MKIKNADFFYCDETNFPYGGKDDFAIVVRMSKSCYYIKTYVRGWARNVLKDRFKSYEEARIFGEIMCGLVMKSKNDFVEEERTEISSWNNQPHKYKVWVMKS